MDMSPTPEFVGQAARKVPEGLQVALKPELAVLFQVAKPRAVTVSYCYTGYTSEPSLQKVILGVEVKLESGFDTHIVKIGIPAKVAQDADGWQECLRGIEFTSRIFLPVQRHDLPGGRVAVIYRDAFTLYGPDRFKSLPVPLEEAVHWAVLDDRPAPASVERAIMQTYTDLGRWLYHLSAEDAEGASTFYHARLKKSLHNWRPASADASQHQLAAWRYELRRDAVWLFCGKDAPESDKPAVYLDPCDYVAYALRTGFVPPTLVGRAHGDLHGRNIIVGVQRGEVEYPAVFDYGEMGLHNVVVWDFVKLETELKVRMLPMLYREDATREGLLLRSPRVRTEHADEDASRADRLEFAFRFERLLAERTGQIQGRADAEARSPPGGSLAGLPPKIGRLLGILLRIRQEAALWLGYELARQHRWRAEYDFALAIYGLVHARPDWDYEPRQAECALVSAGVAAAHLPEPEAQAREAPSLAGASGSDTSFPSYRGPLAIAHRWWKAGRIEEAAKLVGHCVAADAPFGYAVPLVAEHALLLAEQGEHVRAKHILEPLKQRCRQFGDFETLCRIGRAYKDSGDDKWGKAPVPFAQLHSQPAWQMYRLALTIYQEAFDFSGDYYPGVNAATLALLCGEEQTSRAIARVVLENCERLDPGIWVFASEGEAALLAGQANAASFYGAALDELDPSQPQPAQSMYNQLCRLWQVLGGAALEPVLCEFESRPAIWRHLVPGPVGDCGGRIPPIQ